MSNPQRDAFLAGWHAAVNYLEPEVGPGVDAPSDPESAYQQWAGAPPVMAPTTELRDRQRAEIAGRTYAGTTPETPNIPPWWTGLQRALEHNTASAVTYDTETPTPRECPACRGRRGGGYLVSRHGRYGRFLGCTNYPECRYSQNAPGTDPHVGHQIPLDVRPNPRPRALTEWLDPPAGFTDDDDAPF